MVFVTSAAFQPLDQRRPSSEVHPRIISSFTRLQSPGLLTTHLVAVLECEVEVERRRHELAAPHDQPPRRRRAQEHVPQSDDAGVREAPQDADLPQDALGVFERREHVGDALERDLMFGVFGVVLCVFWYMLLCFVFCNARCPVSRTQHTVYTHLLAGLDVDGERDLAEAALAEQLDERVARADLLGVWGRGGERVTVGERLGVNCVRLPERRTLGPGTRRASQPAAAPGRCVHINALMRSTA